MVALRQRSLSGHGPDGNPLLVEHPGQVVDARLGRGDDERSHDTPGLQDVRQETGILLFVREAEVMMLGGREHRFLHLKRTPEQGLQFGRAVGDVGDIEQKLALLRSFRKNEQRIPREAPLVVVLGAVEHHYPDRVEREVVPAQMIDDPFPGTDHHVGLPGKQPHLLADSAGSAQGGHVQLRLLSACIPGGEFLELPGDLLHRLDARCDDHRLDSRFVGGDREDHGKDEGSGFAFPVPRFNNDVSALQDYRNRPPLQQGRAGVSGVPQENSCVLPERTSVGKNHSIPYNTIS